MRLLYDLYNRKVCRLQCKTCFRWEKHISSCKNFSFNWIYPGTENVAKGIVKKHVDSIQHKKAEKLETKIDLGAEAVGKSLLNLTVRTRKD